MQRGETVIERATGITFRPGYYVQVRNARAGEGPTNFPTEGLTVDINIPEDTYMTRTNPPSVHLDFETERELIVTQDDSSITVMLSSDDR